MYTVVYPDSMSSDNFSIEKKIAKLSEYLELEKSTFNSFVDWTLKLREKIKIPHTLSELVKLTNKDMELIAPMALNDPSTSSNPIQLSKNDFLHVSTLNIYKSLLKKI